MQNVPLEQALQGFVHKMHDVPLPQYPARQFALQEFE